MPVCTDQPFKHLQSCTMFVYPKIQSIHSLSCMERNRIWWNARQWFYMMQHWIKFMVKATTI